MRVLFELRFQLPIRPFDYEVKDAERQAMPRPIQSIRDLLNEGAKIVNNLPKSEFAKNNKTRLNNWIVVSDIENKNIGEVSDPFYQYQKYSDLTWQDYYEGIKKATLKDWPLA